MQLGAGATLLGRLSVAGTDHAVLPGLLLSAAASWRLLDGRGRLPFLLLGVSAGGSGASTREVGATATEALTALDVRAGLTAGKTFWSVLSPYVAARAFGGPVFWRFRGAAQLGTDQHHVQVGAGLVTSLARGFDLFAEVDPLGERGVVAGGGRTF